ncbi:thioredoxin family protein [Asanoa sp. NPDC049518]|uniref:thioredoxin family protein n=1 Tax=unclassified Asanoa TaxID=2685164 RepID=UPI00341722AA
MGSSAVTGLVVAAAVLVVATAFGLWRKRHDGRLRPVAVGPAARSADTPGGTDGPNTASRSAAPRAADDARSDTALPSDDSSATLAADDAHAAFGQTLLDLGVDPATPVTLLQFSSAFCAPCRTTRRVLADVATMLDGVAHVEVDAESHLEAVRALDIWRTPTTLIVTGGRIVQRAGGVPAKAQVVVAIAPMIERSASAS